MFYKDLLVFKFVSLQTQVILQNVLNVLLDTLLTLKGHVSLLAQTEQQQTLSLAYVKQQQHRLQQTPAPTSRATSVYPACTGPG